MVIPEDAFQISVVIPTFNRATRVVAAMQSVLDQSAPPHEVIVVDDGSSDGTEALIRDRFGDQFDYIYQSNRGVSHARNAGIQRASGNWIAFLDSDDQWMPEKLQVQMAALANNPGYGFCHTNEIWIRKGKRVNPMNKHDKCGGYIYQKCLPLCVISPSSVLMRREIFDETGWFDESLPACEDYDYWLRYCSRYPVLYIESPQLIKHGGHSDQLSRHYWGMDRFRVRALLNMLESNYLSEQDTIATIEMVREKCRVLQAGAAKRANHNMLAFCQEVLTRAEIVMNAKCCQRTHEQGCVDAGN